MSFAAQLQAPDGTGEYREVKVVRVRFGIVRFASVAAAIEQAIGGEPLPRCEIGHGRIRLTFRGRGASRWPEAQQVTFAFQVAALARDVMSADERERVHARVSRAILVAYEDAAVLPDCTVRGRWECLVMPSASPPPAD